MKRFFLIFAPIVLGIAGLVLLVKSGSEPQQAALDERVHSVRVISVPSVVMVPRLRAYGVVTPGRVWEAAAEVAGKVVYIHPQLDEGEFLSANSTLVRIDATDYQLAIAQINADLEATSAQLMENKVQERNTRELLTIAQESLTLSSKELARQRQLAEQGALSQTAVDQQDRNVLAQRQSVVTLENSLRLTPVERERLVAQRRRYQAQLEVARHNLERTVFKLPFDARIAQVNIELSESVRVGDILVRADDISVAEIKAEVLPQQIRNSLMVRGAQVGSLDDFRIGDLLKHVKAQVRLADFDVTWQARLVRFSPSINPKTRTLGAIVEVSDHYRQAIPGVRPPLVKDMFVQVEFWGAPRPDTLVIPRSAVHAGVVYVVGPDRRLGIRPVTVGLVQAEFVSIDSGLEVGARVIVSDLQPAITGLLLEPYADEEALARLVRLARGEDA